VTFRNLGWSGDTVWGEARAEFGSAADGFRKLRDHVLGLKPTVIVVGYGTNESFAGPAGVAKFETQLRATRCWKLLPAVQEAGRHAAAC